MVSDPYAHFFNVVYVAIGIVTVLTSLRYLAREGIQLPEYNLLLLFSSSA